MARSAPPKQLLMQWHITDRCNLRCQHCYQEDYQDKGPGFTQLLTILDQYEMLLAALSKDGKRIPGQINITGGEPFIRDDFLHLLKEIKRRNIPFAILTNGSLIDYQTARFIKALTPRFIQLSIEGTSERHDLIRGTGDHAKTIEALHILKRAGIRTMVSFTAHQDNYREFPAVAALCHSHGVARLWSDRFIPPAAENVDSPKTLSPEETREFFTLMAASASRYKRKNGEDIIAMHRALQFLLSNKQTYRCNAGYGLITIMPDGSVLPCRRLPITAGNIFESSLSKIYFESKILQELRNPDNNGKWCGHCMHKDACGGGLRCLAYAITGDPFRPDPGCWLAPATTTTSAATAATSASGATTTGA